MAKGNTPAQALAVLNRYSRDHARTPMQWNTDRNAGFTQGTPWLMVNPNYSEINAQSQQNDPDSVLNYYRALIQLRKQHPVMVYGDFCEFEPERQDVYVYTRTLPEARWLIVLNLTGDTTEVSCPVSGQRQVMLSNYPDCSTQDKILHLRPWEAIIYCM